MGNPGFPIPPPGGRVWAGAALPGRMFIPSGCGASRMDGCGDHRSPRSAPLPASPRWREEPDSLPQRGRAGEGAGTVPAEPRRGRPARALGPVASGSVRHAHDSHVTMGEPGSPLPPSAGGFGMAAPSRASVGKPGFPTPPPAGGPGPHAGVWGNRVSPDLRPREGEGGRRPPTKTAPSLTLPRRGGNRAPPPSGGRLGGGQPGFPIPVRMRAGGPRTRAPAHGRVRESAALP